MLEILFVSFIDQQTALTKRATVLKDLKCDFKILGKQPQNSSTFT